MSSNIEERRVQRLGTSSLIVTLPKKWVRKVNLNPGDKVIVVIEDNEIKILPPSKAPTEKERYIVRLDRLESEMYMLQLPICLYLLGVKDVVLDGQSLDIKIINKIINKISNLSGTQVTCLGNNRIEIKVLVDPEESTLDLLQSIFKNLILILRTVRKALEEEGDVDELIDDAKMLQKEIYKKYYSILRLTQRHTRLIYDRQAFPNILLSSELGLLLLLLSKLALETVGSLKHIEPGNINDIMLETISKLIELLDQLGSMLVNPECNILQEVNKNIIKIKHDLLNVIKTGDRLDLFMASKIQDFISLLEEVTSLVTCWQTISILINKKLL